MKRLIIVIGILAISTSAFGWGFGPGGGGSGMTYPGAGVAVSTGSAWDTTLSATVLAKYAGVDPSANVLTLLGAADYATFLSSLGAQAALGLVAGTYTDANLCTYTSSGTLHDCNTPTSTFELSNSNNIDPDRLAGDSTEDGLIDQDIIEGYAATSSPTTLVLDSDAPGTDKEIAKFQGAYIDGADGSENGTISIYAHESGASTEYIQADGKNVQVEFKKVIVPEAGSKAQDPIVDSDGLTMAAPGIYGGTYIASGAGTWAHSTAIAAGENWSLEAHSAAAVVLTINASDTLWLNGTAQAQGVGLTSDSTVSAFVACQYKAANTITCRGVSFTATP